MVGPLAGTGDSRRWPWPGAFSAASAPC